MRKFGLVALLLCALGSCASLPQTPVARIVSPVLCRIAPTCDYHRFDVVVSRPAL